MTHVATAARRTGSALSSLLLAVITVACLAYIVPGFFGFERYVITGGSMSGTFERGSIAFEKAVPVDDLKVGDVITYLPPTGAGNSDLVTHRILTIEPGENGARVFTTQGDANSDPDPWTFSLVDGTQPVVQTTVPYVGHAFIALANPDTRRLVIGVPAGIIALIALAQLGRAVLGRDDERTPRPAPAASHATA